LQHIFTFIFQMALISGMGWQGEGGGFGTGDRHSLTGEVYEGDRQGDRACQARNPVSWDIFGDSSPNLVATGFLRARNLRSVSGSRKPC
jgi:hypothetical protein